MDIYLSWAKTTEIVAAPCTPSVLALLVAAHNEFKKRKRLEFELWCNTVADEIDARNSVLRRRKAAEEEFFAWCNAVADDIDSPVDLE